MKEQIHYNLNYSRFEIEFIGVLRYLVFGGGGDYASHCVTTNLDRCSSEKFPIFFD